MLLTSFEGGLDIIAYPPKLFFKPTLTNFYEVFHSSSFLNAYGNTLILSTVAVLIAIVFGGPAAYSIERFRFKGRSTLNLWILATRFMPPMVLLLPFYQLYNRIGLRDTYTGLTIIYVSVLLPFIIWVLYGFIVEIPIELEESAAIDGAHPFFIYFKIVLPILAPGLVATAILCVITTWNELLFVMILGGLKIRTLPLEIVNTVRYDEIAWGRLAGVSLIAVLPVFVFTILIQKYLVSGLTFGSLK
jgi:multiple sugar transport system permease protein